MCYYYSSHALEGSFSLLKLLELCYSVPYVSIHGDFLSMVL